VRCEGRSCDQFRYFERDIYNRSVIAVNTAIFGLIDHLMLRLMPVRNPRELMVIRRTVSYPNFEEMRSRNGVFSSIFAVHVMTDLDVKNLGSATGVVGFGKLFSDAWGAGGARANAAARRRFGA
jgi:hypothetical protein